jgi:hypothetical protein
LLIFHFYFNKKKKGGGSMSHQCPGSTRAIIDFGIYPAYTPCMGSFLILGIDKKI